MYHGPGTYEWVDKYETDVKNKELEELKKRETNWAGTEAESGENLDEDMQNPEEVHTVPEIDIAAILKEKQGQTGKEEDPE